MAPPLAAGRLSDHPEGRAEAPLTVTLTIGLMDGGQARECFAADFGDERSVNW